MIALVLLAAGVLTLAVGVALMVAGGRAGSEPAATGHGDWADGEPSRARPGVVVGALLATLGVVLGGSGAVVLVVSPGGSGERVVAADDRADSTAMKPRASTTAETPSTSEITTTTQTTTITQSIESPSASEGNPRGSGDLGLSTPITRPSCDGRGIVVLHSAVTPGSYESEIRTALANNPGAKYLRTDQSCPSLRQTGDNGNIIYAVYRDSGYTRAEVCADVAVAPGGAYGRWLDTTRDPSQLVTC